MFDVSVTGKYDLQVVLLKLRMAILQKVLLQRSLKNLLTILGETILDLHMSPSREKGQAESIYFERSESSWQSTNYKESWMVQHFHHDQGLEKELIEGILKTFWSCYLISGKTQEISFIQKNILLGTVSPTLKTTFLASPAFTCLFLSLHASACLCLPLPFSTCLFLSQPAYRYMCIWWVV